MQIDASELTRSCRDAKETHVDAFVALVPRPFEPVALLLDAVAFVPVPFVFLGGGGVTSCTHRSISYMLFEYKEVLTPSAELA